VTRIEPGGAVDAAGLPLAHEALAPALVVSGAPTAGWIVLDESASGELGVWEHTPGTSTDIESDEVFVVLSGSATLSFDEPSLPSIELRPGVLVRLAAGMRTVWTVRETLRKVYVTPQ